MDIYFSPEFKKNVKQLEKKYRHLKQDLMPLIEKLQLGEIVGVQIPNIHLDYKVYKARLTNQDMNRGKSGGYRVIYYVQTQEKIILVSMYAKSEQQDISPERISQIILETET